MKKLTTYNFVFIVRGGIAARVWNGNSALAEHQLKLQICETQSQVKSVSQQIQYQNLYNPLNIWGAKDNRGMFNLFPAVIIIYLSYLQMCTASCKVCKPMGLIFLRINIFLQTHSTNCQWMSIGIIPFLITLSQDAIRTWLLFSATI